MGIHRLNHVVLYVRDVARTTAFYTDVLDFRVRMAIPGRAAFLQAPDPTNDHEIGLVEAGGAAGPVLVNSSSLGGTHVSLVLTGPGHGDHAGPEVNDHVFHAADAAGSRKEQ